MDGLNTAAFVLTLIMCVTNLVAGIALNILFYTVVKTQDILSSKINTQKAFDFLKKLVIPLLWLVSDDYQWLQVLLFVGMMLNSFITDYSLFYYLPYYRITILNIATFLRAIQTPLSVSFIFTKILESTGFKTGIFFCIVLYFLLMPLFIKAYFSLLRNKIITIFFGDVKSLNRNDLIHKDTIYHHIRRTRHEFNEKEKRLNMSLYLFKTLQSKVSIDLTDSKLLRGLAKKNLEAGSRLYEKSMRIKLVLANHYVKHEESYLFAYNLIREV
jgi:hypothetical protein